MKAIFSLVPLTAVLLLPFKGKGRRGLLLAILLSLGALGFGWKLGLIAISFLYVIIFLSSGLFQLPLKQEVHEAVGRSLPKQLNYQEEIAKYEEECRQWTDTKAKLGVEIEEITRRFAFTRHLVSQMEEEPVLKELKNLITSRREVKSFLFSAIKEDGENKIWDPQFHFGAMDKDQWRKILEKVSVSLNRSTDQIVAPLGNFLPSKEVSFGNNLSHLLVGVPIRWEKKAQGLLSFVVREPLNKEFLELVQFCGQVLGLWFRKASLYRTVLERSRRDGLTQLYLRRVFLERLKEEINFSKRYGTSFSLLMLDLDHFKKINDEQGHLAGDEVLKSVAQTLKETLHPGVTLCRYGGEEFAALIGLAPREEVFPIAEGLRVAVQRETAVTISIGVAHYLPDSPSYDELIRRADGALYQAKGDGRNCVREWS